ncbi:hypothetical protein MOTE_12760 [Moorella thermoacetica]|uniref:Uncharacterized protein n=1 Tax=Neomoorella thermoacetica TaxID=1525 RepID=A0A1J5P234_NEOTH|nr:hypothetical protein MOTE_12760 [Moorella thermoacetica]
MNTDAYPSGRPGGRPGRVWSGRSGDGAPPVGEENAVGRVLSAVLLDGVETAASVGVLGTAKQRLPRRAADREVKINLYVKGG